MEFVEEDIVCSGVTATLDYDDEARTVTRGRSAGLDQNGDPCGGSSATVEHYDADMILVKTERWLGAVEPVGEPSGETTIAVEETGTACVSASE